MSIARTTATVLPLALCAITCVAQQNSQKQQAVSPSTSQTASSPAGGIKFVKSDWLTAPPRFADDPDDAHTVILCYTLEVTGGISQPYNFRRISFLRDSDNHVLNCSPEDDSRPTVQDSRLVFAFDARRVSVGRITDITLSLTTAQGNPLTPVGVRPSIGAGVTTTNLGKGPNQIYYVYWPNRIAGDVLPTATITATYIPPVLGQRWEANTYYAPGSIVTPDATPDGHFYMTLVGGTSHATEPTWQHTAAYIEASGSPACQWQAVNSSLPATAFQSGQPRVWAPNTQYAPWTSVVSPTSGTVYIALRQCTSGNTIPLFALAPAVTEETVLNSDGKVQTGSAELTDTGQDSLPCTSLTLFVWKPNTPVTTDMTLCDEKDNNRQYRVTTAGTTGPNRPNFAHKNAAIVDARVPHWLDQGLVQPASVASAAPTESSVTPLNGVPYPQTHSLSTYNLASGVVVSTIRTPSFAFSTALTTNNGTPVQTGSTLLVDPVIFLGRYLKPFDAENRERKGDILASTTVNLGFSLSSPTNNFYLGASNEFLRYIQFNYGFALARVPKLAADTFVLSSATSPNTVQVFKKGAYFGLSFNISGFVQGLTGSPSSGSTTAKSSGTGH